MPRGPIRLFAGRRITLARVAITLAVIVGAFAIGIGAGWATSLLAQSLSQPSPTATTSPSPTPSPTPQFSSTADVSLPPMSPVTRTIDDDDHAAGLRTLDFPVKGDATFATLPAPTVAPPDTGIVQFVRVDVEDGLQMSAGTLSTFVMNALNDAQGWGNEGPTTYVQTDGAPDIRVLFASPYSAAALCPTPHEPAALVPTGSPSPTLTPAATMQCAQQGAIVVSIYDWIQGLDPFGDDRTDARIYLLNHALGHVLGRPDVECTKGVADVMVNQRTLPDACTPNPWPFPAKD